jgi:hypothetical protein
MSGCDVRYLEQAFGGSKIEGTLVGENTRIRTLDKKGSVAGALAALGGLD